VVHANARLTPAGRLILVTRIAAGRPAAHVAAEMGVSRTTAYRWAARYQTDGEAGLADRPSTAHSHPHKTPPQVEQAIARLRRSRKLGPARIAAILGLVCSTVHRVLTRLGLHRLAWLDRPTGQPIRVVRRYERATPGELVHLDVKKLGRIPDGGGHKVHGRVAAARADLIRRGFTVQRRRGQYPLVWGHPYIPTWEGWLYLATVIDIASRRVVGFALAEHLRTELACDALTNAVAARDPVPGVIFHSDKGCQDTGPPAAWHAEQASDGAAVRLW
jgi:transposase InsO family protein